MPSAKGHPRALFREEQGVGPATPAPQNSQLLRGACHVETPVKPPAGKEGGAGGLGGDLGHGGVWRWWGRGMGRGPWARRGGAGAVPWRPDSRVLLLGEGALMGLLEKRVNPCASHVFANSRSLKEQEPHLRTTTRTSQRRTWAPWLKGGTGRRRGGGLLPEPGPPRCSECARTGGGGRSASQGSLPLRVLFQGTTSSW